jgi:hypothetical protein
VLHATKPTPSFSSSRMALVSFSLRHVAMRTSTLDRLVWIEAKSFTSAASNKTCCAEDITTSNRAPLACVW